MLEKCSECRQSVSDSAEVCPHCGYRLVGRENLVFCPTCKTDVLPVVNPHDTISKYCPVCNKPITALAGRKVFFLVWILMFVGVITVIAIIAFSMLRNVGQFP